MQEGKFVLVYMDQVSAGCVLSTYCSTPITYEKRQRKVLTQRKNILYFENQFKLRSLQLQISKILFFLFKSALCFTTQLFGRARPH